MSDRLRLIAPSAALLLLGGAAAARHDGRLVVGPPMTTAEAGLQAPLFVQPPPPADEPVVFESIPVKFGGGRIQLSGGYTIDPADWKAVAIAASCTLTLIGPDTVLLAAHCVDNGSTTAPFARPAKVTFDRPYQMDCRLSEDYTRHSPNPAGAPRSSHDYALCKLDGAVPSTTKPEVVGRHLLPAQTPIRLMGYGCIDLRLTPAGNYAWKDGRRNGRKVLRMGDELVEATQVSLYPNRSETYLRTLAEGNSEPVLCPGDSGGPVLVSTAPASPGVPPPGRRIVALNSAMGATPAATPANPSFYSYLSPLGTPEFQRFVTDVAGPRDGTGAQVLRKICGHNVTPGTQGCRR